MNGKRSNRSERQVEYVERADQYGRSHILQLASLRQSLPLHSLLHHAHNGTTIPSLASLLLHHRSLVKLPFHSKCHSIPTIPCFSKIIRSYNTCNGPVTFCYKANH